MTKQIRLLPDGAGRGDSSCRIRTIDDALARTHARVFGALSRLQYIIQQE